MVTGRDGKVWAATMSAAPDKAAEIAAIDAATRKNVLMDPSPVRPRKGVVAETLKFRAP
jgi:hypothetical protein